MPYKVLIPQDISPGGKNYLSERGYNITIGTSVQIDINLVGEFDAILIRTAPVNEPILRAAKKLKVVSRYGVGVDNIDIKTCKELGIRVTFTPLGNIVSVAEYVILMMLQCAKNTRKVESQFRPPNNNFNSRDTCCGTELMGKTLGIIGAGKIGTLVEKKAQAFDTKIVLFDPCIPAEKRDSGKTFVDSLDDLLEQSDFVTIHIPLTENTRHYIGEKQFECMKKTAWFINASRGPIVDEAALTDALKSGKIAGAAIDVFEKEPPDSQNPLFGMDNVIVSPHIAGMTIESSDRVGIHAAMGIDDVLSGRNPEWVIV
jgi:D-3-phosphoglycerate dehydrogenase